MVQKIKQEYKDEIFKKKESYVVTKDNIEEFFNTLEVVNKKLQDKETKDKEDSERSARGEDLKPEDLDRVAEGVVREIGSHLNHLDFLQHLVDDYKANKIKHKPVYTTQGQIEEYKVELAKLFHSISVKLRLAKLFGFGNVESCITVVDTEKLPSLEEAKKLDKKQMKEIFNRAEDNSGKIDNKSTKTFKK